MAPALLVAFGLILSWSATLVGDQNFVQLVLVVSGASVLVVATTLSRHAALALLAALLIGHVGFSTAFAKTSIDVGGLPLYVTDFLLAPVLAGSLLSRRWRTSTAGWLTSTVALFAGVASAFGLASLMGGAPLQVVLYLAIPLVYYPLTALALAWNADLFADRLFLIRVALLTCAVAVMSALLSAAEGSFFVTEQGVPRYLRGDSGTFIGAVFVALLLWKGDALGSELARFAGGTALLSGIVLSEHRSIWVAVGLGYLAGAAMARSRRTIARGAIWLVLFSVAAMGAIVFMPEIVTPTLDRLASTTDSSSINSAWRLAAWDAAVGQIADSPILGHGFGASFVFFFWGHQYVGAPHNSLINITWYMGIPGLALFALVQGTFVTRLFRHRSLLGERGWYPASIFAAWLTLITVAAFNVILESPVGAVPFWLVVGLPFAFPGVQPEPDA
jgi:O-antigen ligase